MLKIVEATNNHVVPITLEYRHDEHLKVKNTTIQTTDGYEFTTSPVIQNLKDIKSNRKSNLYLTKCQTIADFIEDDSRIFDSEFTTSIFDTASTMSLFVSSDNITTNVGAISGEGLFVFEKTDDGLYYIRWFNDKVFTIDTNAIILSTRDDSISGDQTFTLSAISLSTVYITTNTSEYLYISANELIVSPSSYEIHLNDYQCSYNATGFSMRGNEWVVYYNSLNSPTRNQTTEIDSSNSISAVEQNYIVNWPHQTQLSETSSANIEFLGLKNIKHIEGEYSYIPVSGIFTQSPENLKLRDYDKIYTGTNQDEGLENIYLSYQTDFAKALHLPPDKITYFHYPEQAPVMALSSVALEYNGAFASDSPIKSDRIYKKMANYKQNIYWGDSQQWQTGVWLCAWLSASPESSETPVWMDRWYFPGFVTYSGALIETTINNQPTGSFVWDEPSTMTMDPGVWYKYVKFGDESNKYIVETLAGEASSNLKMHLKKWDAITEDYSIYGNDGFISNWSPDKLTFMDLEYNPKSDNYALELDGSTSVTVPYSETITPIESFSVNFWVYADDWANAKASPIIGNYYRGGWRIGYSNNFSNPIIYTFDPTYGHIIPYGLEGKVFADNVLLYDSIGYSTPVSIAVDFNHYAYILEQDTNSIYKSDYDGVVLREANLIDPVVQYIELGEFETYDVVYVKPLQTNVVSAYEINCLSFVGTLTAELFSFTSDGMTINVDEFLGVSGNSVTLSQEPTSNAQIYINGMLQNIYTAYISGDTAIFNSILNDDIVHIIQSPLICDISNFSGDTYTIESISGREFVITDFDYNGNYLVFINGLLQDDSQYSLSLDSKTITFNTILSSDDITIIPLYNKFEFLAVSGTQIELTSSQDISDGVAVYINGLLQSPSFYSVTITPSVSAQIDFDESLSDDIVHVVSISGGDSFTPWAKHFTIMHTINNNVPLVTQFAKKIIVDNNNIQWEIIDGRLYKNGLPWVSPATSELIYTSQSYWSDIVCDKNSNIWAITESGVFYKFDDTGVLSLTGEVNNESTDWSIGLTYEFVKPPNRICDVIPGLSAGDYYTFIHFNANDTSNRYVYTQNGDFVRRINPLHAIDISKYPNDTKSAMRFSIYGDFSGYEYHRKYRFLENNQLPQFYVEYDYFNSSYTVAKTARMYYSPSLLQDTWQQIGFTFDYDNSISRLYINSKLEDEIQHDAGTFIYQRQKLPIMIGDLGGVQGGINSQFGNTGYGFEGKIADVRIYDNVINASDLKHLYLTNYTFKEITWTLPTGPQNILEEVERFFKHKLPGMKSQYYNIHIIGIQYENDIKEMIETAIKQALVKIAPVYTELNTIVWDSD